MRGARHVAVAWPEDPSTAELQQAPRVQGSGHLFRQLTVQLLLLLAVLLFTFPLAQRLSCGRRRCVMLLRVGLRHLLLLVQHQLLQQSGLLLLGRLQRSHHRVCRRQRHYGQLQAPLAMPRFPSPKRMEPSIA